MDDIQNKKVEYDECAIYGVCSINPALAFMQKIIIVYLQALAFYLLKIEDFGLFSKSIEKDMVDAFAGQLTSVEYNQDHVSDLLVKLYKDLYQAKEIYRVLCRDKGVVPQRFKPSLKITQTFYLSSVIRKAKNIVIKSEQVLSPNQKKMIDVLLVILRSICLYLIELSELNVGIEKSFSEFLHGISVMNIYEVSDEKLDEMIKRLVYLDNKLMQQTFIARKTEFGELTPTEVSLSAKEGKAILVTGANMKELELILEATKNKGINVYTHGQMITGHIFPKLKAYPNLAGHYGKGVEYCMSDFTLFPGVVYLSKLSLYQAGHLYHGKVFTSDKVAQKGIVTISENNFEPLIEAALSAEGFSQTQEQKSVKVGVVEGAYAGKFLEIVGKILTGKIKHLIAIGVSDNTEEQRKYFEKFLDLIGDDCYVISTSYTNNRENVLHVNIDYVFPFSYKSINMLIQKKIFSKLNTTIFFTHCEPHTIPNLFMLRDLGIKNLFFGSCPNYLVNPAIIETLRKKINIRDYTTPEEDLKYITGDK